jgi:hypothetical protein
VAAARAAAIVFRTTEKYSSLARYKVKPVIVPVKGDFFRQPFGLNCQACNNESFCRLSLLFLRTQAVLKNS